MSPFLVTLGALARRFAAVAGSALLAYVAENLMGWAQGSFMVDPKTAILWPLLYGAVEFVQKYLRERAKVVAAPTKEAV